MRFLDKLLGKTPQEDVPSPVANDPSSEEEQSASGPRVKESVCLEATAQIIAALSGADMDVTGALVQAADKIGDEKAVEGFAVPSSDDGADLGAMVARALEDIGGEGAIEGLIAALSGPDARGRRRSADAQDSARGPDRGEAGSVGIASPSGSGSETGRDIARGKSKEDVASTIPGFWECYYGHEDAPEADLLKISRRAGQIEIMYVDRRSLYGPKYPKDKYYDIRLDDNGIRYRFVHDEQQASVELQLVDENCLKGCREDPEGGKIDCELLRVSEADLWSRKR
jgi:hypothetical protein